MLVLQRKVGESILIGEETTVTILAVEGGRVRVAVEAPKHITILRNELKIAAQENHAAALQSEGSPMGLLEMLNPGGKSGTEKKKSSLEK